MSSADRNIQNNEEEEKKFPFFYYLCLRAPRDTLATI